MPFTAAIKVNFADIDNAGIVYYPRFGHYFHLAMEQFFPAVLDLEYAEALHKKEVLFPTVHLVADFHNRLSYGDTINMEVKVLDIGNSAITWGYSGTSALTGTLIVTGGNVTVCVNKSFKKIPVPAWLRQRLEAYMEESDSSNTVPPPPD